MNKETELKLTIIASIVFATITTVITGTSVSLPDDPTQTLFTVKVFLTTFNTIILSGLTVNYLRIYRDIPSSTSRSLLIFSAALTLYAVSANPLLHVIFGYNVISIGPFTYLPDLFVAAASISLLHESYK